MLNNIHIALVKIINVYSTVYMYIQLINYLSWDYNFTFIIIIIYHHLHYSLAIQSKMYKDLDKYHKF